MKYDYLLMLIGHRIRVMLTVMTYAALAVLALALLAAFAASFALGG